MSEAIEVAIVRNKKNKKELISKCAAILIVIGLIHSVLLLATSLFEPYVSEDVYSYLASFLFFSLSGVFYGLSLHYAQTASFSGFITKVKRDIGTLIVTMLIAQLFVFIGYVFIVIPGLILTFLFFLYPYVVTQEEKKYMKALKRSCQLYTHVWFRLPVAIIGLYLLFLIFGACILMIFPNAQMAAEIAGGTLVFPIEMYVFYRLYKRAIKLEKIKRRGE